MSLRRRLLTLVRSYHIGLQIDSLQFPLPCYHRVNIHNSYDEHTQLIIMVPESKYVREKTEKHIQNNHIRVSTATSEQRGFTAQSVYVYTSHVHTVCALYKWYR